MRSASTTISHFCSLQDTNFIPPEQRRFRRIHGLQLPLHPQQVVGWIALVVIGCGTIGVLIPLLNPKLQAPILCLIIPAFFVHFVSHIVVLLLDPAEAEVRAQPTSQVVPEFDRTKHLHVIENGRCHLCNINASSKKTKHCSICNKCITRFDHHCKWLNNCIGGRNYKIFIVYLISAILSTFTVASVSATELSLVYLNSVNNMTTDNVTLPLSLQLPGTGSLIVISIVGIISAIAAVLLIHLCFFHGYIACLGLTTYEYLRNKREKNETIEDTGRKNSTGIVVPCPSFCTSKNETPVRYHFCEAVSSSSTSSSIESNQIESRNVYICSTHNEQTTTNQTVVTQKDRRNFHLYFSYEARNTETSIELMSQTVLDNNRPNNLSPIELKPSTPSPVSCCFSIINPSSTKSVRHSKHRKHRDSDADNQKLPRSCTTMRRIQTFLRSRLRKNAIQRSIHADASRKSRIAPAVTDSIVETTTTTTADAIVPKENSPIEDLSPLKLQPLTIHTRPRLKQVSVSGAPLYPFTNAAITKRGQAHFRARRSSLHKRPRLKMGSHVMMQSAQLSPIPESELSKPASPRSPPQTNHFTFPPSNPSTL